MRNTTFERNKKNNSHKVLVGAKASSYLSNKVENKISANSKQIPSQISVQSSSHFARNFSIAFLKN